MYYKFNAKWMSNKKAATPSTTGATRAQELGVLPLTFPVWPFIFALAVSYAASTLIV